MRNNCGYRILLDYLFFIENKDLIIVKYKNKNCKRLF